VEFTPSKIIATFIACCYLALMIITANGITKDVAMGTMGLLFSLTLIWFPEKIGDYTGMWNLHHINHNTPAFLVSAVGWFFLVGAPIVVYLLV
jgi:hypothetical protein